MVAELRDGTAEWTIEARLAVPGQPEQVRAAREFVIRTLGADHPCTDFAVLLSSELVTNSVRHSDSRLPGGTVTITLAGIPGGVQVEVLDAGGASVPHVKAEAGSIAESGRGLRMVSELSARWGYRQEATGRVTWFEVRAEPGP